MFEVSMDRLREIKRHWADKERLCDICSVNWAGLTNVQRNKILEEYNSNITKE